MIGYADRLVRASTITRPPGSARRAESRTPDATDGIDLPAGLPFEPREVEGYPKTDFNWPVVPDAFGDILRTFRDRYGDRLPPIYITENGCAINDGPVERRSGGGPAPDRLPGRSPTSTQAGHRRRCRRPRILPVVVAGQLRMGRRATRSGSAWSTSTSRRQAAHAQGVVPLVSRADRQEPLMSTRRLSRCHDQRLLGTERAGGRRCGRRWTAAVRACQRRRVRRLARTDPGAAGEAVRCGCAGQQGVRLRSGHRGRRGGRRWSRIPCSARFPTGRLSRFGRRVPWVLAGAVGGALGLLVLAGAGPGGVDAARLVPGATVLQRVAGGNHGGRSRTGCRGCSVAWSAAGSRWLRRSARWSVSDWPQPSEESAWVMSLVPCSSCCRWCPISSEWRSAAASGGAAVAGVARVLAVLGQPTALSRLRLGLADALPAEPRQRPRHAVPVLLPAGRGRVRRSRHRRTRPDRDLQPVRDPDGGGLRHLVGPAGPSEGVRDRLGSGDGGGRGESSRSGRPGRAH